MRTTLSHRRRKDGLHASEVLQARAYVGQVPRGEFRRLAAMDAVLQGEQLRDFVEAEAQSLR